MSFILFHFILFECTRTIDCRWSEQNRLKEDTQGIAGIQHLVHDDQAKCSWEVRMGV